MTSKIIAPFEACVQCFINWRTNNSCHRSVKELATNGTGLANSPPVDENPGGGHAVVLGQEYSSRFSEKRTTIMVELTIWEAE